jgi:hemolysin activation/secretion protein
VAIAKPALKYGSDRFDISYELPFNAQNGSLRFQYTNSESDVIEPPFDDIDRDGKSPDITSNYEAYELTLRQPIIRSINNQTYQEFSLDFSAYLLESQALLFKEFPLTLSADDRGRTNVFALRFAQQYTLQNPQEVFALRSQFSFGTGFFGTTVKESVTGVGDIPDSTFFSWRLQGQYVNLLAKDTLFIWQQALQLADQPLLASEQFSLGGISTVRGYRQDQILTDNAFFTSAEIQFPLLRVREVEGILHLIPFWDYGIGWNVDGADPDNNNNLVSFGLGLQWRSKSTLAGIFLKRPSKTKANVLI